MDWQRLSCIITFHLEFHNHSVMFKAVRYNAVGKMNQEGWILIG